VIRPRRQSPWRWQWGWRWRW